MPIRVDGCCRLPGWSRATTRACPTIPCSSSSSLAPSRRPSPTCSPSPTPCRHSTSAPSRTAPSSGTQCTGDTPGLYTWDWTLTPQIAAATELVGPEQVDGVLLVPTGDQARLAATLRTRGGRPVGVERSPGWLVDLGERRKGERAPAKLQLAWSGPAEFSAFMKKEVERWSKIVKENRISAGT